MARLICLGGGVESVPMIRRVQELGHRAIVVDGNPNAPAFAIADRCSVASCYHGDVAVRDLKIIGEQYDGVLCCGVDAPVACAEIAAEFNLPGLSVDAAKLGQSKLAQKSALLANRVPVPDFWIYEPDNVSRFNDAVIKPIDSRGGRGVIRLLKSVNRHMAYDTARQQSPSGQVMVEEWLDGPQLSTESIVQDGRVLFTAIGLRNYDRLDEFAPYCIEDGFDEPFVDTSVSLDGIRNTTTVEVDLVIEQAARALDWYQHGAGTVKGDLVIHYGRVMVIELACRLSGGFFSTHGHPLAYGVDFVGEAIKAALGERLEETRPTYGQYVCQRYVFPAKDDIGKTVVAIEEHNMGEFNTYNLTIGDVVKPVTCHPDRWGQVITTGRSVEEARQKAAQAVEEMYAGVILS